jgi:hypothetical protein
MTAEQLTLYSSWASIVSFFISLISLVYLRSIKTNIVRFRRKQRMHALLSEVKGIPDDAIPLSVASKTKIAALKRNIPMRFYSKFTQQGKLVIDLHRHIETGDIVAIKEVLNDWTSYSEEV